MHCLALVTEAEKKAFGEFKNAKGLEGFGKFLVMCSQQVGEFRKTFGKFVVLPVRRGFCEWRLPKCIAHTYLAQAQL